MKTKEVQKEDKEREVEEKEGKWKKKEGEEKEGRRLGRREGAPPPKHGVAASTKKTTVPDTDSPRRGVPGEESRRENRTRDVASKSNVEGLHYLFFFTI